MSTIFTQPAPFYNDWKKNVLRYFWAGTFVTLFLIIFQPFGTDRVQIPYKSLFLSGYGIITFLSFIFSFIGLPFLFKNQINEEKWVVWKQIFLTLFALSLTFLGCYLYLHFSFNWKISLKSFFSFYQLALPIALIPTIIISLLDYIYQLKKNQQFAKNLNDQIKTTTPFISILSILDENEKAVFDVDLSKLLFIKAANNYVEINYLEGEQIKKYLLRNSISKIEEQLGFPFIKRCHRSYLVNMNQVSRITGNAQGYKLHFPVTAEFIIPVSRSKGPELLAILKG